MEIYGALEMQFLLPDCMVLHRITPYRYHVVDQAGYNTLLVQ